MAFTYTGEMVDLGFGRGWLNRPSANSIRRIDAQIGHPLQITEAGRDWAGQNKHYQHYLRYGSPIALSPDAPSLHQLGNAADTDEGQTIHAVMEDHGWRRTVYRWVNGKWTLVERWHYEYFPQYDNHRHEGVPSGGATAPAITSKRSRHMDIYRCSDIDGNGNPGWGVLNDAAPLAPMTAEGGNPLLILDKTSGSGPQVTKWMALLRIPAWINVDRDGWETAMLLVANTTIGLRR